MTKDGTRAWVAGNSPNGRAPLRNPGTKSKPVKKSPFSNRQCDAVNRNASVSVLITDAVHTNGPWPGITKNSRPTARFGYTVVFGCSTAAAAPASGSPFDPGADADPAAVGAGASSGTAACIRSGVQNLRTEAAVASPASGRSVISPESSAAAAGAAPIP